MKVQVLRTWPRADTWDLATAWTDHCPPPPPISAFTLSTLFPGRCSKGFQLDPKSPRLRGSIHAGVPAPGGHFSTNSHFTPSEGVGLMEFGKLFVKKILPSSTGYFWALLEGLLKAGWF